MTEIFTTSTFYLKFKENNKNGMTFCYFCCLGQYCFQPTSMAAFQLLALVFMGHGFFLLIRSNWEIFTKKWPLCSGDVCDATQGWRFYLDSLSKTLWNSKPSEQPNEAAWPPPTPRRAVAARPCTPHAWFEILHRLSM